MSREMDLISALIAHAARDGLGEPVIWEDVEAVIAELSQLALAERVLREMLERVNDKTVPETLEGWFLRAAAAREGDGSLAARGDKILTPFQAVSLGVAGTAVVFTVAGTLTVISGGALGVGAAVIACGSTLGRWRLSQREDQAKADARAIRSFVEITRKAIPPNGGNLL